MNNSILRATCVPVLISLSTIIIGCNQSKYGTLVEEPRDVDSIMESLNQCNKEALRFLLRPDLARKANYTDEGETNAWLHDHETELRKAGYKAVWSEKDAKAIAVPLGDEEKANKGGSKRGSFQK